MVKKEKEEITQNKINIQELVTLAQGRFAKKNPGLASSLKTGDQIVLSSNPADYICSEEITKFWTPLTGIMGIPFGRIVQIAGQPDSGKSTAAMVVMRAAEQSDVITVLWDVEGKFDSSRYRDRMGGDPSQILVASSKNITNGAKQVTNYVNIIKEQYPNKKILIVWDSVGASINSAEDEENDDYSKQPGVTAKEVSWAVRRFNQLIEKYRDDDGQYTIAVLCINQLYAQIGFMKSGFKQKGGAELEYLSSIILEMTRKGQLTRQIKGSKCKYGIETMARVKKNHLFGGDNCIAELELVVSSGGIDLKNDAKKKVPDIEELEDEED